MSKKKFTPEQMETLRANKFVLGVTEKSVTFTNAMKDTCIELTDRGLTSIEAFEECGFDVGILGRDRVMSAVANWRRAVKTGAEINEGKPGRPCLSDPAAAEKRLKLENERLRAEVDFLRQLRRLEGRHQPQQSPSAKNTN